MGDIGGAQSRKRVEEQIRSTMPARRGKRLCIQLPFMRAEMREMFMKQENISLAEDCVKEDR
jgi:hypothetical protein